MEIVNKNDKNILAGKQKFKCANTPGSNLTELEDYDCPLWKSGDHTGSFDESGYDTSNFKKQGLLVLCPYCHSVFVERWDDTIF